MAGPEPAQAPLLLYGARLPAGRKANAIGERWLLGHTVGRFKSQGSSSPVDVPTSPSRTIAPAERRKQEALPSPGCRGGAAMRLGKRQYI